MGLQVVLDEQGVGVPAVMPEGEGVGVRAVMPGERGWGSGQ